MGVFSVGRAALLACSVLGVSASAQAQQARGFRLDRFEPAARGSDFFVLDSLDLRGHVRAAGGLTIEDGYRPLTLVDGNGNVRTAVVANQAFVHAGGSVVLWNRLRLGANLPIQVVATGTSGNAGSITYPAPARQLALGDARIDAAARLFGSYGSVVTGALGASVFLPTGDPDAYAGNRSAAFEPHALAAGEAGSFLYAARIGVRLRGRDQVVAGTYVGSDLTYGAAFGARLLARRLVVGPELHGGVGLTDTSAARALALEALLGAHYAITPSWRAGVGFGFGLGGTFGAALLRGAASIEWAAPFDPPKPAVIVAPTAPPPPVDRDHDGVDDLADACPDVAGEKHADDPLAHGCPADRDHDFVADAVDACPDVKGSRSTDPKKNGCPADKDGDGVLDGEDACELERGIRTDDPATNGCADPDRDKDGVPNATDACPDEAGAEDVDPTKTGCPPVGLSGRWIRTRNPIAFRDNTSELAPGAENDATLAEVARFLVAHPEILRVRVEAHTDNSRSPATSKRFSEERAAAVVRWLTAHGVEAKRLAGSGYGSERPLLPNSTEEGRKLNRRIEFHAEEVAK